MNKLDTLTSCIQNTNVIFNNGSSAIQNHNFTGIFKDDLNERKLKLYQAFRSQERLEKYNRLISEDDKFVPDKSHPKTNKIHPNSKNN